MRKFWSMDLWTIGLLVLCVCGSYVSISEAIPIQQQDDENERSYKRELDLFEKEVEDNWEHDDNEFLSRRELNDLEDAKSKKTVENDNADKTPIEDTKRWLDVDLPNANGLSKESKTQFYDDLPNDGELFEGDIVMDTYVREVFNGEAAKRDAVSLRKYYWPNGIVHYAFDPDIFPYSKEETLAAIREYHKYTCIKFIPKTDNDGVKDYILFISNGSRCYSNVGRRGGKQKVSIGTGCLRLGTPIHEIKHVLGFFHEMARPDRDEYVVINWNNIDKRSTHNFHKIPFSLDKKLEDYNFDSVMHYSNRAFSKNGKDTITSLYQPKKKFGQRCGFSVGDIKEINKLYGCPERNNELPNDIHYTLCHN